MMLSIRTGLSSKLMTAARQLAYLRQHRFLQNSCTRLSTDITQTKPKESAVEGEQQNEAKPFKFTTSKAHQDYVARYNFSYSNADAKLPASNNIVLILSAASFLIYFLILREENDWDEGVDLFKPVHETVPHMAIPMLKSAIKENQRFGKDTTKLEAKLAELMKEPEKYGGNARPLVANSSMK